MASPDAASPPPLHEQLSRLEAAVRRAETRRIWPGVALGLVAGMVALVLGAGLLVKQARIADVREVCAPHAGVQQVESMTWDWAFAGSQIVVCRDGYVDLAKP